MNIRLRHATSGMIKECKIGFSWTTLFFGIFVPLVRGDIKWMLVMFLISCVTLGFSWLVFPFIYNKIYVKNLLEKGYMPNEESDRVALQARGIVGTQSGTQQSAEIIPPASGSAEGPIEGS